VTRGSASASGEDGGPEYRRLRGGCKLIFERHSVSLSKRTVAEWFPVRSPCHYWCTDRVTRRLLLHQARASSQAQISMLTAFPFSRVPGALHLQAGCRLHQAVRRQPGLAQYATLPTGGMLSAHVRLSILAVPVVLHGVVLRLTHPTAELPRTIHPCGRRFAVVAWAMRLGFGIITCLILAHIYPWEMLRAAV